MKPLSKCTYWMLFSVIKQLYSELFSGANGDRADDPNIAIIATDREGNLL